MASPAKAFINPSGLYLLMNSIQLGFTNKAFLITDNTFGCTAQIEEITPRFSIVTSFMIMMKPIPLASVKPNTNQAKNMAMNTFSSIYQERGASAARPTEGQLYPLGI